MICHMGKKLLMSFYCALLRIIMLPCTVMFFFSCLNITVIASECYLLYYYIFCAVAADSHPKSDGISL